MGKDRFYIVVRCVSIVVFVSTSYLHSIMDGQTLPLHTYSTRDGLPSSNIQTFCQDSKGFMWIGTEEGLSVYDGESFRTYTAVDGLTNSYVTSVIESKQSPGMMLISTIAGGVFRYQDDKFTPLRFGLDVRRTAVTKVVEDLHGTIWCSTSSGVFKAVGDTLQQCPTLPIEYISGSDIVLAPDGNIWAGVNRRVYVFSPDNSQPRVIDLDLRRNGYINAMMVDRDGDIWIATTDSSLRRFSGDKLVTTWDSKFFGNINHLILDADGDVWMTSGNGILRTAKKDFPRGHVSIFARSELPHEGYFDPVFEDREGNIWFGGSVTGVHRLTEKNILKFPLPKNDQDAFVDKAGHLWLKNNLHAWECWQPDEGGWQTIDHQLFPENKRLQIMFMRTDLRGRVWLLLNDSTIQCDTVVHSTKGPSTIKKLFTLTSGKDFPSAFIWMLYVDSKNYLWLSLHNGIGVIDLNVSPPKFLTLLRQEDEVRMSSVRAIYRDSRDNVWFGGFSEGLSELVEGNLSRREMKHFTTKEGLPDNGVRSFAEDDHGRLWIGTRFGGVAIYDDESFQTISIKQGLLSNAVWSLVPDERHQMWLGTGSGAVSINMDDLGKISWSETMTGEGCLLRYFSPTKTVWMIRLKEAAAINESIYRSVSPPVYISKITINDKPIDVRSGMEFQHYQNNVVIEFIGLSFKDERSVRYQYCLEGIDTGWNALTHQRVVSYAALKPGTYSFSVIAINKDGIKSPTPAHVAFTIHPPLWQRWWFIGLVTACVISLTYVIIRRKIARIEERRSLQEEFSRRLIDSQENERSRIAGELHDSLGQNLLVIKNQALLALDASPKQSEIIDRLDSISNVTTQTIAEVREIAHNLRPYHLDKLGLTTSIQSIIRRMSESSGIIFTSEIGVLDDVFSKEEEIHVYRIVQEALNNIVKHSKATEATVSISADDQNISMTIRDNGTGFATPRTVLPDPHETPNGFGLIGIGERVRILNGNISFGSTPGHGTSLIIYIPRRRDHHA